MAYPTSTTTFATASGTEVLNSLGSGVGLAGMLNVLGVDVTAVETKIGTGSSTPTSNTVLAGNGTGTSAWVSTLAGLTLTTPTLTTPTIASFVNANHNHTNSAGGGTLGATAITGVNSTVLSNAYKFSVYRGSNQTVTGSTDTKIQFDTENFDTGSNYDNATNFRFTATVAGFYWFNARVQNNGSGVCIVKLFKNGLLIRQGTNLNPASNLSGGVVSDILQLSISDYVEVYVNSANTTVIGAATDTYFSGFLVSTT